MAKPVRNQIWGLMKNHIHWVYLGAICSVIQAFFDVIRAILLEKMLDTTLVQDRDYVIGTALALLGIVVIGIGLSYFIKFASYLYAYRFDRSVRDNLIHQLIRSPISTLHRFDSGDLVTRLNGDTRVIKESFSLKLHEAIYSPIVFILSFSYLLSIHWQLTLVSVVLMPISIYLINLISKPITRLMSNIQVHFGVIQSISSEVLAGVETIKSFGLVELVRSRYNSSIQTIYEKEKEIEQKVARIEPINILQRWGTYLICTVYSAYLATIGDITAGELLVFLILVNYLINPITTLPGIIVQFRTAKAAAERIKEVLSFLPENSAEAATILTSHDTAIELQNIAFSYDNNNHTLSDLNLKIPKNQITAIVGPSGSGKSTLFSLLCGFYMPQKGKISYFGQAMDEQKLATIRQHIGLVSQETYLFPGTILENITCFEPGIPFVDVLTAVKQADALSFIEQLPHGFDTKIGEAGIALSGGQKQRIAIARAILKNASILLFDEPTSALDYETEASIHNAMVNLSKEKTIVVIAHRLSSVVDATQIVVMEKGRLVQQGPHAQLLAEGGLYRKYFYYQMSEEGELHEQ
ncbi:ABC transporter ATP-binding protein/permease [Paenibacillus sp. SC116]|uniref:ABC transporter ATP-binding protein n=1 Tax=Paenibacillus sp. SC116 TaxID=2968986 RepID=UPI00215AD72F|nr:ABC transporter ATP-binding protein [Paenibacillus sp. SC116]MCR8842149.1 ABC transporter ATP-binding protein/permease [Paenibacillus sp. SC116]